MHRKLKKVVMFSEASCAQALRRSKVGHGGLVCTNARGIRGGQNTISSECLLIDRYIMWQAAQKIQLALDPSEDLLRWHEDLEIPKSDWGNQQLVYIDYDRNTYISSPQEWRKGGQGSSRWTQESRGPCRRTEARSRWGSCTGRDWNHVSDWWTKIGY